MLAELRDQDHGQHIGAGEAAGVTWKGAGGWVIRLALPAQELLAYCLDHPPLPRPTSSVPVMSSPSFDILDDPQQGKLSGAGITTRSRGKGLRRPLALTTVRSASWLPPSRPPVHLRSPPFPALRAQVPSAPVTALCAASACRKLPLAVLHLLSGALCSSFYLTMVVGLFRLSEPLKIAGTALLRRAIR